MEVDWFLNSMKKSKRSSFMEIVSNSKEKAPTKVHQEKNICVKNYNFIDHTSICLSLFSMCFVFLFFRNVFWQAIAIMLTVYFLSTKKWMISRQKDVYTILFCYIKLLRSTSWIMGRMGVQLLYFKYYSLKESGKKRRIRCKQMIDLIGKMIRNVFFARKVYWQQRWGFSQFSKWICSHYKLK